MTRTLCLEIGGHVVGVETADSDMLLGDVAFAPFVVGDGVPEWTVRYGCRLLPPADGCELLNRFPIGEKDYYCRFLKSADCFHLLVDGSSGVVAELRYGIGADVVEVSRCPDSAVFSFTLWFAYSLLAATSLVAFVHSSTVVWRGSAVMFLGGSGTGKSTHSGLWLRNIPGSSLLNDDSPVVRVDPSAGVMVHGSPWSGKTPCYRADAYPLAAVVRLSQAPRNGIRRLVSTEAFVALQPSFAPTFMLDEGYADRLLEIASAVITAVPVYHLECLPDDEAARLCFSTIFSAKI